jgi:two-component system phosphate regulon sensor histidine kinase PhoR
VKILWKQFLLSFLTISLILFLFTVFIISELKKYDESLTEERLFTTANLLCEVLKTPIAEGKREEVKSLVPELGKEIGVRITVIARDGVVIGDSEHDPATMENHAARPEVIEAASKGVGRSRRYSITI